MATASPARSSTSVRPADPLNRETPAAALRHGLVTANADFYVRNHFAIPELDAGRWRVRIGGLVKRPLRLGRQDLLELPARSDMVTLECAGNGRSQLRPPVAGEQWGLGAVGTAEWTGVPLVDLLDQAGLRFGAKEVLFRGADGFERSLTVEEARDPGILLAYAMNGRPLPAKHGSPLRVIVPGWYAVADVKWLVDVEVVGNSFSGHFQTSRYIYEWERAGEVAREPVRRQRVRALITEPTSGDLLNAGALAVRGLAWSGVAPVARVEVSVNGEAWRAARLLGHPCGHCWQRWELTVRAGRPGWTTIRARATDAAGRTQPGRAEWNRLGYGINPIQEVSVRVE
ncbi:MAG: sulfite oxidase [Chloroflexi bacterium]|nr:MAG: sulfite oxidase [Chloroflexota bacterium]